jgi:putative endonuclease
MPYYVYILKSDFTCTSYIGHTSNLEKRLGEHNNGKSLSTRKKGSWKLIYQEEYPTRSEAARRERYFKSVQGRLTLKENGIL